MRFFTILAVCILFAELASSFDKEKHCKCRIEAGKRIVGGRIVFPTNYPWHISLSMEEQQPKETRRWIPAREKIEAHSKSSHLPVNILINNASLVSFQKTVVVLS